MNNWKSNHILNGGYSSYLNGKYHAFQGLYKSLEEVKYSVEEALEYAASLEDKNKELEDEHWRDEKLQQMKDEFDRMEQDYYRGFPITKEQMESIRKWEDQHWTNRHNAPDNRTRLSKMGAIGGSFEYRFTPTSIGTVGSICCQSCMRKVISELSKLKEIERADKEKELIEKYDAEFVFKELC